MEILKKLNLIERLTKRQILLLLFVVAFILRLGLVLFLGSEQNLYENGEIAENLVAGRGYSMQFFDSTGTQETCAMAPVYPFLIALAYLIFGVNSNAILAFQIFQVVIGALTVFPLYYLSRKFYSHRVSVYACVIFVGYPDFLYSAYIVQQLVLTTFLIPIILYLSHNFFEEPTIKRALVCGIIFGFSLLVEPIIISILILTTLWIFIFWFIKRLRKQSSSISLLSIKKKLKILFIFLISCVLIILPWLIRCYIVYGRFVLIKANGFNFWRGNNPEYTKTGVPSWFGGNYEGMYKEGDIDQKAFNMAIDYVLTHIPETIINDIQKIGEFWWFPRALSEQSPLIRMMIYAPLLGLFILGLFIDRKRLVKLLPLLIPLIGLTLLYSTSFVLPRYRVPIQPIMFIFSAHTLVRVLDIIFAKLGFKNNKREES